MSDLVRDLLFRASDQNGVGWTPTTVVHVPAGLLHRAADEIERLRAALRGVKWRSADKDNMEFAATITYSQMDEIRAALAEEKKG
jgi:hypothetical protein